MSRPKATPDATRQAQRASEARARQVPLPNGLDPNTIGAAAALFVGQYRKTHRTGPTWREVGERVHSEQIVRAARVPRRTRIRSPRPTACTHPHTQPRTITHCGYHRVFVTLSSVTKTNRPRCTNRTRARAREITPRTGVCGRA